MKALTEFTIALFDLVEAEGRDLRTVVMQVGTALMILLTLATLSLIGAALLVRGLYLFLASWTGPAGAATISGLIVLALSGPAIWMTYKRTAK